MRHFFIVWLLVLFILGCVSNPSSDYQAISNETDPQTQDSKKAIDITELIEQRGDTEVADFKEGPWTIAVHSFKTGYTYYYDENNRLLGKRSEFKGNPREDLVHQKLGR